MLKKIFKIGCVALIAGALSVPAWSFDNSTLNTNDNLILAGRGHGPGDGTGNGGSGPQDGSGNGSKQGTCPNLKTDVQKDAFNLARRGNCGNGSGTGQGGGTGTGGFGGNGGVCPWGLNS
jgi:hypothetical protein